MHRIWPGQLSRTGATDYAKYYKELVFQEREYGYCKWLGTEKCDLMNINKCTIFTRACLSPPTEGYY